MILNETCFVKNIDRSFMSIFENFKRNRLFSYQHQNKNLHTIFFTKNKLSVEELFLKKLLEKNTLLSPIGFLFHS